MLTLFCFSLCVSLCVQGCDSGTTSAQRTAPLSTPTHSSSWTKLWPPKSHTRRYLAAPHPQAPRVPPTSSPPPLSLHLIVLSRELARTFAPMLMPHKRLCRRLSFATLFSICSSNACTHTRRHFCARTHSHPCSSPRLFTHSLCGTLQLRPRHHHPIIGGLVVSMVTVEEEALTPVLLHSPCLPSLSQHSLCTGSHGRGGYGKPPQHR